VKRRNPWIAAAFSLAMTRRTNTMNSSLISSRQVPAKATAQKATELHAKASPDFTAKLAETEALLQSAAADFKPVTQASSLGAEDVVITHIVNRLRLDIPVFVLDTGALHTETMALLERTQAHSRAPVQVYRPEQESVIWFIRNEGQDAMFKSIQLRKACCNIRKMEPLARALNGKKAWMTGLRKEQSNARAGVALEDDSEVRSKGLYKFNPLAHWTWGDVWHYIAEHQVDYNPLHDQFFPSIGCAPCTRAISLGEEFRAGRWWWEDEAAKECGLHVKS
jgi:phosphoadenosine phosphosulfate reductase